MKPTYEELQTALAARDVIIGGMKEALINIRQYSDSTTVLDIVDKALKGVVRR